jgi:hypothetical protein
MISDLDVLAPVAAAPPELSGRPIGWRSRFRRLDVISKVGRHFDGYQSWRSTTRPPTPPPEDPPPPLLRDGVGEE